FFSSRRRHTRFSRDWSSDVCSSDLLRGEYSEITWWCVDVAFIRHLSRRFGLEGCDVSHFMKGYRQNHSHLNSLPSLPRRDERVRSEERRVGKECRSRSRRAPYTTEE